MSITTPQDPQAPTANESSVVGIDLAVLVGRTVVSAPPAASGPAATEASA